MKSKFYAPTELLDVKETLSRKEPYAMLVVSTTGLDNSEFSGHSPIRVVASEYEYDDNLGVYKENVSFDRLVQAPKEAVEKALSNTQYDIFGNGGIDKEKYLAGENVLSVQDFKEEFNAFMKAIKESNASLILNGGERHCKEYLDKIGCGEQLENIDKLLDQTRLTSDYFKLNEITGRVDLKTLRNSFLVPSKNSFINEEDAELLMDFNNLSKEDFLKKHTGENEASYNATTKDFLKREEPIIGGDERIKIMNKFVTEYGRSEKVLPSKLEALDKQIISEHREELSEKGKAKYKSGNLDDKFSTLIQAGTLDAEKIMSRESQTHKLFEELAEKQGITIIHCATTGFEDGGAPKKTGYPIQFTAICYEAENGRLNLKANKGFTMNIQAPSKSLALAEEKIKKGTFNAFEYAGINYEDYKAGKGVVSSAQAQKNINEFFKVYPIDKYPIVAIGGIEESDLSFTQVAMQNLGNFAFCQAPHYDLSQIIKEYSFFAHNNNMTNVLIDESKMTGKTFSLESIAKEKGIEDFTGTKIRCLLASRLINSMVNQDIELFREDESEKFIDEGYEDVLTEKDEEKAVEEKTVEEKTEEDKGTDYAKEADKPPLKTPEINSKNHMKKDEYLRRMRSPHDYKNAIKDEEDFFAERLQDITEGVGGGYAKGVRRAEIQNRRTLQKDESVLVEAMRIQAETINAQNKIIESQSKVISAQNEKLCELLKEQNEILKLYLGKSPEKELGTELKPVELVEKIKEEIHDISDAFPKAEKHFMNANVSLSEGQKVIEEMNKEKGNARTNV